MIEKPIIFDENSPVSNLEEFKKNNKIENIIDIYESQLHELFDISFPNLISSSSYETELLRFIESRKSSGIRIKGGWVFFPWNKKLLHILNNNELYSLRTNRNRNIITQEEQKKLHGFCVGIAGLS